MLGGAACSRKSGPRSSSGIPRDEDPPPVQGNPSAVVGSALLRLAGDITSSSVLVSALSVGHFGGARNREGEG